MGAALENALAGGPLGGRRPHRRWPLLFGACAVLAVAAVLASAAAASALSGGYWFRISYTPGAPNGSVQSVSVWQWRDESGKAPGRVEVGGKSVDNSKGLELRGEAQAWKGPADAPEGWYKRYDNSSSLDQLENNKKNPHPDPSTPEGQNPLHDKPIGSTDVEVDLLDIGKSIPNLFAKGMHFVFRGAVEWMLDMGEWFLGLMGANAQDNFTQDFHTGTFARFYRVAKQVSRHAFEPYALAFLGVMMGVSLIKTGDSRRRLVGQDWLGEVLAILALYAVSVTLILHAIDLCAGIYWLAQNLVRGVGQALGAVGIDPGNLEIGITDAMLARYDAITFGQAGVVFPFVLLAFAIFLVCVGCSITVLTIIFLRIGEIYLRAAASPLCLSFLIDERARAVGMGYIKRFFAVCFQAAIIFIALALAPLFMEVAAAMVSPIAGGAPADFGAIMSTLIPALVAVLAITATVKASEQVSNGLFGLGG